MVPAQDEASENRPRNSTQLGWDPAASFLLHRRLPSGQSGSGCRKEALGQALREGADLGFQWLVFIPGSGPSWTCVYLYRQYTFIGACCTVVLSERLKGDVDLALG